MIILIILLLSYSVEISNIILFWLVKKHVEYYNFQISINFLFCFIMVSFSTNIADRGNILMIINCFRRTSASILFFCIWLCYRRWFSLYTDYAYLSDNIFISYFIYLSDNIFISQFISLIVTMLLTEYAHLYCIHLLWMASIYNS